MDEQLGGGEAIKEGGEGAIRPSGCQSDNCNISYILYSYVYKI